MFEGEDSKRPFLTGGVQVHELDEAQKVRINVALVIGVVFFANVVFFSVMWAFAFINSGEPITQTFSAILAVNTKVQIIYSAWWVYYLVVNCVVFFMILEKTKIYPHAHHLDDPVKAGSNRRQHCYTGAVWFYVFLNLLKQIGLLLLFIFPVDGDTETLHLVFAGIAFVSAVVGCFVIFVLRCTRKDEWEDHPGRKWVLFLNFLSIAAEIVMLFLFKFTPVDNAGVYEFVLALLIMLDTFYILTDYWWDALDNEIIIDYERFKRQ